MLLLADLEAPHPDGCHTWQNGNSGTYLPCSIHSFSKAYSPWYNCHGWLGIKRSIIYLIYLSQCTATIFKMKQTDQKTGEPTWQQQRWVWINKPLSLSELERSHTNATSKTWLLMVTFTWHASKYKVHKLPLRYIQYGTVFGLQIKPTLTLG